MTDPVDYARSVATLTGEWWECGVFRGDTALSLRRHLPHTGHLRLFDTWTGRPPKGPCDTGVSESEFADCDIATVRRLVGGDRVSYHQGLMPATFAGLGDAMIAFAYIDLDLYQSTVDALAFIAPRLVPGGLMLVDDYDAPHQWPGVRRAIDDYWTGHITLMHRRAILRP